MTRTEIINGVIKKNGYTSYLEIGIYDGKNFDAIECENKTGVDPNVDKEGVLNMTSDALFASNKYIGFDLIFIDGDHTYIQSKKDLENALKCLNEGGLILMHDTNPNNLQEITPRNNGKAWCGEVWKTVLEAKAKGYPIVTIPDDYGVTIIKNDKLPFEEDYKNISSEEFLKNKSELMNFMNWRDYMNITEEVKEIQNITAKESAINDLLVAEESVKADFQERDTDDVIQDDLEKMTDEELKEFYKTMFGSKPKGKFNREKIILKIIS